MPSSRHHCHSTSHLCRSLVTNPLFLQNRGNSPHYVLMKSSRRGKCQVALAGNSRHQQYLGSSPLRRTYSSSNQQSEDSPIDSENNIQSTQQQDASQPSTENPPTTFIENFLSHHVHQQDSRRKRSTARTTSFLAVEPEDHPQNFEGEESSLKKEATLSSVLQSNLDALSLTSYLGPQFLKKGSAYAGALPSQNQQGKSNHVAHLFDEFVRISSDEFFQENESALRQVFGAADEEVETFQLPVSSEQFDAYFSLESQSVHVYPASESHSLLQIMDNILMSGHKNNFSYFSKMTPQQKQHMIHILFRISNMRRYYAITVRLFEMLYSLQQDPTYKGRREVKELRLTPYIFEKTFLALGRQRNAQRIQWLYNIFTQTDLKPTPHENDPHMSGTSGQKYSPLVAFSGDWESTVAAIISAFSDAKQFEEAEEKYEIYEENKLLSSPLCFRAIMNTFLKHSFHLQQQSHEVSKKIITSNPDTFTTEHISGLQGSLNEEQYKRQNFVNQIRQVHERAFQVYTEYKKRVESGSISRASSALDDSTLAVCLKTFSGKEFSDKFLDVFLDISDMYKQEESTANSHIQLEKHYATLLNYLLQHEEELLLYFSKNKEAAQQHLDSMETPDTLDASNRKTDLIYQLLVQTKEEEMDYGLDSTSDDVGVSHLPWNLLQHMNTHLREPMSSRIFAVMTHHFCKHGDHRALSFVREAEENFDMHQTPSICLSIVSLFEILVAQKKMTEDDLQFAINNSVHVVADLNSSAKKMKTLHEFHELISALSIIEASDEFLPEPIYNFCIKKLRDADSSEESASEEAEVTPLTTDNKVNILNKLLKIYIRDGIEVKITQILDMFFELQLLPNESTFKIFMREFQTNPMKWMQYRTRIRNLYPTSDSYTCTAYIWTCLDAEKARKTLDYMRTNNIRASPTLYDYVIQLLAHVHDERAFDYIEKRIALSAGRNFYILSYSKTVNAIFKNFYPSQVAPQKESDDASKTSAEGSSVESNDSYMIKKLRRVYDNLVVNGGVSLKLTQAMMNLYTSSEERRKVMEMVKYKRSVQHTKKFRPLSTELYFIGSKMLENRTGSAIDMPASVPRIISEEQLVAHRQKQEEENASSFLNLLKSESEDAENIVGAEDGDLSEAELSQQEPNMEDLSDSIYGHEGHEDGEMASGEDDYDLSEFLQEEEEEDSSGGEISTDGDVVSAEEIRKEEQV